MATRQDPPFVRPQDPFLAHGKGIPTVGIEAGMAAAVADASAVMTVVLPARATIRRIKKGSR
jgi:hypothetical protein